MPDRKPATLACSEPVLDPKGGSDDRFRRLIAGLHVGVVVQGPASEILILNPSALELLGVTEAQILGRTSFDPYWKITREDGSEFPASERPVATVLGTRQRVSNVVIGVHRPQQRDKVWLLINAEPEFGPDGQIAQVVATLADITERKRLEASLLQARKLESIGRLAGGIAHDFNNLLTVIIGSTSLALETLPQGARERLELTQSLEAAERAASLTRQLLTFARRQVSVPTCIDLASSLRALEPLLARLIGEHIELSIVTHDAWPVDVDLVQLEQVIVNLAVNARDAMPNGGRLQIEIGQASIDVPAGEYTVLRVSDTGHGMDANTRDHLFEPFFSTKDMGTGLGLATVYGIVEQHGGFVSVQSEPGRGATFAVHFKRSTHAPTGEGTPSGVRAAEPSGKGTILVIEDEPLVRNLARAVLEKHGYEVLVAGDGLEGLACAKAHVGPIQLVVTDLVMPKLDGQRTAMQLKAARPEIAVIITSGYSETKLLPSDTCFLAKPYSPLQLLELVRLALEGRHEIEKSEER